MSSETDRKLPPDGTMVRAKRLGWDEVLTPEQEMDMEPYDEHGYESDDLEGPIISSSGSRIAVVSVGGQSADPKTVQAIED